MKIAVFNIKGENTGRTVLINENLIKKTSLKKHIVYLEIKRYLSANRQGTHKTKERGEVSRTKKKFQRQKGTGNARKGSLNSPIIKGGGRAFGPRPKSYRFKLNKSVKKLAKSYILSNKIINNKFKIIENFSLNKPKTKELIEIINSIGLLYIKTLFIINKPNKSLYLSSRNLKNLKISTIEELNGYDMINYHFIAIMEDCLSKLHERFKL